MNKSETKPYLVTEYYYPKEENMEDVMQILLDTSAMVEGTDGALMCMALRPEKPNGAITSLTLWENRKKFLTFMKSEHAEKIMKSGLAEKVKGWTTDIKADLYSVEYTWHVTSHD